MTGEAEALDGGWGAMPDPLGDREADSYRVTAEFYDLHHYRRYRRKAQRDLAGFATAARAGILEVGSELRESLATAGFTFVSKPTVLKPTVPESTTNGVLCFRC